MNSLYEYTHIFDVHVCIKRGIKLNSGEEVDHFLNCFYSKRLVFKSNILFWDSGKIIVKLDLKNKTKRYHAPNTHLRV